MQVQLTQEAKIASDFPYIRAIFAVVGFVSALTHPLLEGWVFVKSEPTAPAAGTAGPPG